MTARDFLYVGKVQACIDIGRKLAIQEVHDDATRRRRFDIAFADGCGWINYDYIGAFASGIESNLLRHELGTLVVAHHIGKGNGRVLVYDLTRLSEAHGRH